MVRRFDKLALTTRPKGVSIQAKLMFWVRITLHLRPRSRITCKTKLLGACDHTKAEQPQSFAAQRLDQGSPEAKLDELLTDES